MQLEDLTAHLEDAFTYPVELETVLQEMGDLEIEGPDDAESVTVASILRPLGSQTFDSPEMLYEAIYGNVSDEHIGRKFYDDRGGNTATVEEGPSDDVDVSF